MKIRDYDKKLNGEVHPCEVCDSTEIDFDTGKCVNVQHHLFGSRFDSRCIWVCPGCHATIHNPTAHGLPARWAYDNFYLLPKSKAMGKKKKSKKCNHKTYFDRNIGLSKCQLCPMTFHDPQRPKIKEAKAYEKQSGKAKNHIGDARKKVKIGYEKQDPRIAKAANLKTKYQILKRKWHKAKDTDSRVTFAAAITATHKEMEALQTEMGGES